MKSFGIKIITYSLWILLYFTSFEGFGLRTFSWGGLGKSSLGWFGVLQVIVAMLIFTAPLLLKKRLIFKEILTIPLLLLNLLLLLVLFQAMFINGSFSNFLKLRYIYIHFLFVLLLSLPNGLKIAVRALIFCALLSSFLATYIILTGYTSDVITVLESDMADRTFRVLLPTSMLIAIGFFINISKFQIDKGFKYLLFSIICFVPLVLQMHRNVLISLSLVILYSIYKLNKLNLKNFATLLVTLCGIILGSIFVFSRIGFTYGIFVESLSISQEEIFSVGGNFGIRVFLVINSFTFTIKNYFPIGVGLKWEGVDDHAKYLIDQFVAGPTLDSGFANIIIVFGLLGLFVYIYLFYSIYRGLTFLVKNYFYRTLSFGLLFSFIYLLITSISTDNFLIYNSSFIFTLVVSITYVLGIKHKENRHEENIFKG